MEYPIWQLTTLGGGFWIAVIATLHVYVAHFAVGGGLFLVLTERAAYKSNNPHLLQYAKKHTRFFLLLTMAFGGVSGVAIWLTVALLAPEATITLIHQFVFGWAAEWVCFLGEIVALIIYYYAWDSMDRRDHMAVGWLYFLFGWLSLFLINGIVGFMLTPGRWIETKSFWDGFFNPSFWPSLVFRSFFSAVCAGLFGFVTATRIKDEATRLRTVRVCSAWTVFGVLAVFLSGWWYVAAMPPEQYEMIVFKSNRVSDFMRYFWIFGAATLVGGLLLAVKTPRRMSFALALVVLVVGQGLFGSFEFIREAGRKPYLIWDTVYSSSILKARVPVINQQGAIASAKWAPPELADGITEENAKIAGAFLFQLECSACHSIHGPMNEITARTAQYNVDGMDAFLTGMGKLNKYMPPFIGNSEERMLLARYIAEDLNGHAPEEPVAMPEMAEPPSAPFDPDTSEYVLVGWCARGMGFFSQNDKWTLLPPSNVIRAQLVLRDPAPERVMDGVTITYSIEADQDSPALTGTLEADADAGRFEARVSIPPYAKGEYNPLPVVTLTAKDGSGAVLATTMVAAPTSDQMGCFNCHSGGMMQDGSGMASATVENILATHDRMNSTKLAQTKGVVECVSCHDDSIQGVENNADKPNLSAAIHGVHAVYMAGREAEGSCLKCHPQSTLRGQHELLGFTCTDCHGEIEDLAVSLLRAEQERGVPGADRLLARITPRTMTNSEAIKPRRPWVNQPDCLTCHVDFAPPETDSAFNVWTEDADGLFAARRDDMDAMNCGACHGSPHAVYPASPRDNMQPMQYMGEAQALGAGGTCTVCHVESMEDPVHHPGMGLD
ncbi:cytochrome ubiquinol oxidase subunit I [Pseudodesulfovibrio thermohalotolerans]|uniref:multiheme c-type cytochrome n=1 Tax=Pseudodesulfovibrio thermohalotolerans TaxID=2880651 RepID=UPI00244140E5|nr:cytochrome ubiquinol oxidase subunit I [Pseudodesulfovibrio thermohalotolerans]WFS62752.1 cytochrome ubiquinol oxidase subunit I [Pseudodesulfovibrio thermohalotolerans]